LNAQLALGEGDVVGARRELETLRQTGLPPDLERQAIYLLRSLLRGRDELVASAKLNADLLQMQLDQGNNTGNLPTEIWADLSSAEDTDIKAELGRSIQPYWRPWLELALLTRTDLNITSNLAALESWRSNYRQHPAAELAGLLTTTARTPAATKVSLMLPISGNLAPAAKSIRDGYLAAYYRLPIAQRPTLEVIDTGGTENIQQLYQDAIATGTQLFIGPLEKSKVSQLASMQNRSIPVIALNRVDDNAVQDSAPLLQLALAPEDEASQLARTAFAHGVRRPVLIRPASAWGQEMADALRKQWQTLGGEVVTEAVYKTQSEISDSIKAAMAIDSSEQRAARARRLMGLELTAYPRRRQDLDGVFLLARTPREARSIKPLLAFHYAAALPVYATSSVYGGAPDRRDRDLEGTRFLEIPWLVDNSHPLRTTLRELQDVPASLTRLQALGTDALLLQQNMALAAYSRWGILAGATGTLTVDSTYKIIRRLHLASFDGGVLRPGY